MAIQILTGAVEAYSATATITFLRHHMWRRCETFDIRQPVVSKMSQLALTVFVAMLIRPLQADVPRCDKNNPDFSKSPYCLPTDYNLDIMPPTDGPLAINVDIFVFEA